MFGGGIGGGGGEEEEDEEEMVVMWRSGFGHFVFSLYRRDENEIMKVYQRVGERERESFKKRIGHII